MTTVQEIESAIERLSPSDVAKLAAWFEQFASDQFDARIRGDVAAGRLDDLAAEALHALDQGRTRPL